MISTNTSFKYAKQITDFSKSGISIVNHTVSTVMSALYASETIYYKNKRVSTFVDTMQLTEKTNYSGECKVT